MFVCVSVKEKNGVSERAYLNIISIKSLVCALHYSGTVLVTAGSASHTVTIVMTMKKRKHNIRIHLFIM